MSLQTLLREVDPVWYHPADDRPQDALDAILLKRSQATPLGRRMLARWLATGPAMALLAPRPDGQLASAVARWPRPKLAGLVRDLGTLAFAPAVRAEVRRDHVGLLKRVLGNGYLLALDNAVWDARVDPDVRRALANALEQPTKAAQDSGKPAAVHALLDRQGRSELHAWAIQRDAALADWLTLQSPPEARLPAVLPEKQVLFLHSHHDARAAV